MKLRLIADTPELRVKGLMFSSPLRKDEAALFLFDHSTDRGFWNKNVSYPIDVTFIDQNNQIINTERLDANQLHSVHPRRPYKYVVETVPGVVTQEMVDRIMSSKANEIFLKIAKFTEAEKEKNKNTYALGAIGGGGLLAKSQYDKGNITGRELLYHNTQSKNVDSILSQGILAKHSTDPNNLTNKVVKDLSMDQKEGLTYLAKKKVIADSAGAARARQGISGANETLKVRAPLWKMNTTVNPELRGATNGQEFLRKALDAQGPKAVAEYDKLPAFQKKLVDKAVGDQTFKALGEKGTAVVKGDVAAKYLTKSKNYEKAGLGEIMEFAKANKGRFVKGVGLAGLGLGAAA